MSETASSIARMLGSLGGLARAKKTKAELQRIAVKGWETRKARKPKSSRPASKGP